MSDMREYKVRDRRDKGWFYLDNEYLNGFGKIMGPIGIAVYVSLCRHADINETCFPSQETIAKEIGVGRRTVIDYIARLIDHRIIATERERSRDGKWSRNVYVLLNKSEWITEPCAGSAHGKPCADKTTPSADDDKNHVQLLHTKNTHINNTQENKTKEQTPGEFAQKFFEGDKAVHHEIIQKLEEASIPPQVVSREMNKFLLYWTEPTKNGKRKRWELEKVFDVKRRLGTWFRNAAERGSTRPRSGTGVTV